MPKLDLATLAWVFTAAVLLHNAEEAWCLPRWSRQRGAWRRPVGDGQFRFAVGVLSLLFLALTLGASAPGWAAPALQPVFAAYVIAMLANALVPHLVVSLATRRYMPGTASAWLLVVPLGSLYLTQAAERRQLPHGSQLLWMAPLVAVGLVATIALLLRIGARLGSRRYRPGET